MGWLSPSHVRSPPWPRFWDTCCTSGQHSRGAAVTPDLGHSRRGPRVGPCAPDRLGTDLRRIQRLTLWQQDTTCVTALPSHPVTRCPRTWGRTIPLRGDPHPDKIQQDCAQQYLCGCHRGGDTLDRRDKGPDVTSTDRTPTPPRRAHEMAVLRTPAAHAGPPSYPVARG